MYSMSGCQTTWNVPRHAGGVEALRGINAHRLAADKRRRRRQQKTNDARHLNQHMINSQLSHSHTLFVLTKFSLHTHVRVYCTSYTHTHTNTCLFHCAQALGRNARYAGGEHVSLAVVGRCRARKDCAALRAPQIETHE